MLHVSSYICLFVALLFMLGCNYCVLTSESASTVMCSLVSRAPTLSSGNSALSGRVSSSSESTGNVWYTWSPWWAWTHLWSCRPGLGPSASPCWAPQGRHQTWGWPCQDTVRSGFLGPAGGMRLTLTAGMLRMCASIGKVGDGDVWIGI
jgi:hypothetical protein